MKAFTKEAARVLLLLIDTVLEDDVRISKESIRMLLVSHPRHRPKAKDIDMLHLLAGK